VARELVFGIIGWAILYSGRAEVVHGVVDASPRSYTTALRNTQARSAEYTFLVRVHA